MQIGVKKMQTNQEYKMFKKSLYVATALISLALIAPVQAQESDHDTRDSRHHRQFAEKNQSAQHYEYQNRHQERREHRRDNHEGYRSAAHHHVEYRNDREIYHHNRRHHHNRHEHHAYNDDLHLIHHLVVVLASR